MKIVTILGTRPEIIKLSPLIPLLENEFNHFILHTGQHYDYEMDEVFFQNLQLPQPKYNLRVGSGPQGKQTGLMIEKAEEIIVAEKPDLVIVQGDTNTVLAGVLVAAKLHIRLMHVESGCRSFNRRMPEEINRIVADHIADDLLAPDEESVKNLLREGIPSEKISLVGSTVFDAVSRNKELAQPELILNQFGLIREKFILVTLHRAENTDLVKNLRNIVNALNQIAFKTEIIFPVHPRTRKVMSENNLILNAKIKVVDPLSYLSFLSLLSACRVCLTDSGGIQEEALVFNVPCLIPREETEWTRLIQAGKNLLLGTTTEKIISTVTTLLENEEELQKIKNRPCPFEAGASQKIIGVIRQIKQINHDSSHR